MEKEFTQEQLESLKGPAGDSGKDGLSDYEIWLKNNKYNVDDRVNPDLKFYINKDLVDYFVSIGGQISN